MSQVTGLAGALGAKANLTDIPTINSSTVVNAGTVITNRQSALDIKPYGSVSGQTGEVRLGELASNGDQYVGFKAPDAIGTTKIWTLPAADGGSGHLLRTDGSGNLSWTTAAASLGSAGGDLTGTYPNPTLSTTGVTPNTYTKVTVDNKGRVTSGSTTIVDGDIASNANISDSKLATITTAGKVSGNAVSGGTITANLSGNATNVTGVVALLNGGTGATTASAAFNALSPMTNPGDIIVGGAGGAGTRLGGNTSSTKQFLTSTGTGSAATTPAWASLAAADISSGIIPISRGGTGLDSTPANGQLMIGNGSGFALSTLSAGTNITVTNGAGAITINSVSDSTKVSKAGDTMSGALGLPADGLTVGTSQLVLSGGNVGIGTVNPQAKLQVNGQIAVAIPTTLAPTGTTQTIDWSMGNMQIVALNSATGNVTLTLSNPVAGGSYALEFIQGATPIAVTWPVNVKWPGGNPMALSTSSGAVDLVTLFYNGTDFLAVGGQNFR